MAQRKNTNISRKLGADAPPSRTYNWKDHPLVIATTAVVGAIAFAILIYEKVIIPTYSITLTNQISSLTKQVESLSDEMSSLRELKISADKELALIKSQQADLERQLAESQNANLFSLGNPYPVGLGKIRVGDPISKLTVIYSEKDIDKTQDGYWSVEGKHKLFNDIVYYFDEESAKKPITHISFSIRYPLKIDGRFLQDKLVETLGSPKQWQKTGFFSWNTQARVVVYKSDDDAFILMGKDYRLGYWPKK